MSSARIRVWDPFLTDQDRAHLALSPDRRVGFGQRPALLLIDLYRWVFDDRPQPLLEAIKTWPGSCGLAAWDALPHLQRVLALAREVGLPPTPARVFPGRVRPSTWSAAYWACPGPS